MIQDPAPRRYRVQQDVRLGAKLQRITHRKIMREVIAKEAAEYRRRMTYDKQRAYPHSTRVHSTLGPGAGDSGGGVVSLILNYTGFFQPFRGCLLVSRVHAAPGLEPAFD